MRIKPFQGLRPPTDLAEAVASPPYDVIDSAGARKLAEGNPRSFLHIVKPEIDLPEGTDVYSDAVYAQAAQNLDQFQAEGWLQREAAPGLYLYRQAYGGHAQTGVVCVCHTQDYEANRIKKHERTLPKKEDDRTRHVATLKAHAGPVFLTYREEGEIDRLIAGWQAAAEPEVDFTAADGVRHSVWPVPDPAALCAAFGPVPAFYVADGHHRSASAARVSRELGEANPAHSGDEEYNWFLCVLFPANQLQVLPYNRLIADLNDLSPEQVLEAARQCFDRVEADSTPRPDAAGQVAMYLNGTWYRLGWKAAEGASPIEQLDVSILQQRFLGPVLGIDDPRTNPRICYTGGYDVMERMCAEVDSGRAAAAFSLYPTSVGEVMAVADEDLIMPPKSTWFEPKLRSGLFVHLLE